MAVSGVQGLTGSADGIQLLAAHIEKLVPLLFRVIADQAEISKAALTALINLSQVTWMTQCIIGIMIMLRRVPHIHCSCMHVAFQIQWWS